MTAKPAKTDSDFSGVKKKLPTCPKHKLPLTFDASVLRWKCTVHDCAVQMYPLFDNTIGKPIVGTGECVIVSVHQQDGCHYLIRSKDTNIMVDITSLIFAAIQASHNKLTLQLKPTDVIEIKNGDLR